MASVMQLMMIMGENAKLKIQNAGLHLARFLPFSFFIFHFSKCGVGVGFGFGEVLHALINAGQVLFAAALGIQESLLHGGGADVSADALKLVELELAKAGGAFGGFFGQALFVLLRFQGFAIRLACGFGFGFVLDVEFGDGLLARARFPGFAIALVLLGSSFAHAFQAFLASLGDDSEGSEQLLRIFFDLIENAADEGEVAAEPGGETIDDIADDAKQAAQDGSEAAGELALETVEAVAHFVQLENDFLRNDQAEIARVPGEAIEALDERADHTARGAAAGDMIG